MARRIAILWTLLCISCSANAPDMGSGTSVAPGSAAPAAGVVSNVAVANGGAGGQRSMLTSGASGSTAAASGQPRAPATTQAGAPAAGAAGAAGAASVAGASGSQARVVCDMPAAGSSGQSSNTQAGLARLNVVLAPHASGDAVDYVDVSLTIQGQNTSASEPLLRLPMVFAGVDSARYDSADIHVEDEMGSVSLSQVDDPVDPSNFVYWRHWYASRATRGHLTVKYRAPTHTFIPVLGSGPPFDLRSEAGGIAGAGVSFLALPDNSTVYQIGLHWDFAAMPANARGVFSRGAGDVQLTGPIELLMYAFYMAGPVSSYPDCPSGPFQAFWLSDPPFDMQAVAGWTEQAYREISTFFRDPNKPYFVFFRHNEAGAMGGAALNGSFMVGYGDAPTPTPERLRAMLAHEIVHNWPSPLNDTASEWYGEGMAEHYSAAISLRAGLIKPDEFLAGLNAQALSYYANPLRDLPMSEVAARFWKDTRVRKIPYDRGALYLASVDAAVRARSSGTRSLDDLMFTMLDRLKSGQAYDSAAWSNLVNSELGADGRAQYQAMVAGELLMPPSNAFGPCFANEMTTYPQFELGFDPVVVTMAPRVVTDVVAGSNAEKAGLREGDQITQPVVLEDVLTDPAAQLTLKVERGGVAMDISYVPRAAAVSGYRWTRVQGVPDTDCAL